MDPSGQNATAALVVDACPNNLRGCRSLFFLLPVACTLCSGRRQVHGCFCGRGRAQLCGAGALSWPRSRGADVSKYLLWLGVFIRASFFGQRCCCRQHVPVVCERYAHARHDPKAQSVRSDQTSGVAWCMLGATALTYTMVALPAPAAREKCTCTNCMNRRSVYKLYWGVPNVWALSDAWRPHGTQGPNHLCS